VRLARLIALLPSVALALPAHTTPAADPPTRVVAVDGGYLLPVTGSLTCSVGTVPVTGPITDTQLRASAVPVSLASVPSHAVTGPLTDAQLRASAVPVSLASAPTTAVTNAGLSNLDVALSTRTKPADQQHTIIDSSATIAVTGPVTDTQLRASAVPVSLASVPTHAVTLTSTTLTGTSAISAASLPLPTGAATETTLALLLGRFTAQGQNTMSNSTPVVIASNQSAVPVSGTFWQTTQPISGTVTANAGTGTMAVSGPLTDTQLRATAVPVSGTVTANIGTAGTLALDATLTGGTQKTKLIDTGGTNVATVKAASTAAAAADTALVVAQSPNGGNPCQNPSATIVGISGATSGTSSVQLVALSGSTKIYVCSMAITGISGTSPTFKLQYGTGSACGTGTVGIVGPWTTAANTIYNFGGANFAVTPAGQALCYLQSGTTPVSQYNITYVQQ
jgi:hypothetical protein